MNWLALTTPKAGRGDGSHWLALYRPQEDGPGLWRRVTLIGSDHEDAVEPTRAVLRAVGVRVLVRPDLMVAGSEPFPQYLIIAAS